MTHLNSPLIVPKGLPGKAFLFWTMESKIPGEHLVFTFLYQEGLDNSTLTSVFTSKGVTKEELSHILGVILYMRDPVAYRDLCQTPTLVLPRESIQDPGPMLVWAKENYPRLAPYLV